MCINITDYGMNGEGVAKINGKVFPFKRETQKND